VLRIFVQRTTELLTATQTVAYWHEERAGPQRSDSWSFPRRERGCDSFFTEFPQKAPFPGFPQGSAARRDFQDELTWRVN